MKLCKVAVMAWLFLSGLTTIAQEVNPNFSADTAKINKMLQECKALFISNPDKVLDLSLQVKRLSEQANFQQGVAYALKNMGVANYYKNNYPEAIQYYKQSLEVFRSLNDNVGISNLLSNIGVIYYTKGDNTQALEFYLQSLQHAELAEDKVRILTALNNVGGVYYIKVQSLDSQTKSNKETFQSNLAKALEFYGKALALSEELRDNNNTGTVAVNIGNLYYYNREDEKALSYFNKSLAAYGDLEERYSTYNAIGKLYTRKKNFAKAKLNHLKALDIVRATDNKLYITQTIFGLAEVLKGENDQAGAIRYYHEAEQAAQTIEANQELRDIYKELAQAYARKNDFQSAFKYQGLYNEKNTEVFNEENEKSHQRIQFASDIREKQTQINLLAKEQSIRDLQIKKQKAFKNALIVGMGLVLIIIIVLYRDYRMKVRINKLLDKQKMQIENLLLNILPQEVAHELQSTGKSTPRNYESVTVLFTDFKSFTAHAEKMSPDDVVKELNTCFMAFDEIIERHNLEKIKTIGDAYMCAGGIPTPGEGHVFRMVKASLEIQEFIFKNNERRKEENLPPWEIRIGINVGPVVAGVVGKKKYAYDIWGSAVNIASRMESNGMPGQINISSSVYEVIKEKYACIYRGKIYAKNVGDIDMYFIDHEIERFDEGFKAFEEVEVKEATTKAASQSRTRDLLQ